MNIAIVVPGGLHPSGEMEIVPSWLALLERLARQHRVQAFVLKHLPSAQTYSLRGVIVHDLGRPSAPFGFTRWTQERALAKALGQHGPFDVIHGFFADPAGQLAARAGKRLNIPSVVTCDSGEFVSLPQIEYGSQRTPRGRSAVADACALASRVHVCTTFMASLAASHGVTTAVIPLTSVDAQLTTISPHSPRATDASFRVIQVASLSRVKNQQMAIDALKIVRQRIDAHLDLIGEDTLNGALQRHARAIGVGPHVTFHGFMPQSQVVARLREAHLYVQSSLHEAAGVSVLEAAAAGVPVVGTRTGYVADWTPLKATAIDDARPESLAEAIVKSAADPNQRRVIADAARAQALAQDAAFSAARFDELYRSLAP